MKKAFVFLIVIVAGLAFGPFAAISGEHMMPSPITHSSAFERMKVLVGSWEGKADMGNGMETLKVTYELTSAGNAILERFAAGKPHEMVTVYYDFGGKLVMTHYCSLGNQPHMELQNDNAMKFVFVLSEKNSGLASLNETHMHALTISAVSFNGNDSLTHVWTLFDKGVKKSEVSVNLVRTKV